MSKGRIMIAFEIWVNGEKFCTAGVDSDYGILTTLLSWAKRDIGRLPSDIQSEVAEEELKIAISGQKGLGDNDFENLQWAGRHLKPGDEIRVKVVDVDQVDPPETTKKINPKYVRKKQSKIILH